MPIAFRADFSCTHQWVAGRSSAYPGNGPVNPDDDKLDHLVADSSYSRHGAFRATRRTDGLWNAGLLTTEYSKDGFQVRTGDRLDFRAKLPVENGAWPAVWTWKDGNGEIDAFEYHPDNPDTLELSNHVRDTYRYIRDDAVHPGAWVNLSVRFGADSVTWWLNGRPVFDDQHGVGPDWSAYLIVNLSVCAGRYHPVPDEGVTEMSYRVTDLTVHRPELPPCSC